MRTMLATLFTLTWVPALVAQEPVVRGWIPTYLESMHYPLLARIGGAQAQVVLSCAIGNDGSVTEVNVVAPKRPSPGQALLVNAALDNAKRWRFRKSIEYQAEESPVTLVYVFRLEGMCAQSCETKFSFEFPNLVTVVGRFRPL